MVSYIRSDLDFILKQIKIAEAHALGAPLYGAGGLLPSYNLAWGLRTVDGSYNNLLPGQQYWGASNQPFTTHVDPAYRTVSAMGQTLSYEPGSGFDMDGAGPDPASSVADSSVRLISNLIVDQTLSNPAAIIESLRRDGVEGDHLVIAAEIKSAYEPLIPLFKAVDDTADAAADARAAADASGGDPDLEAEAVAAEQAHADAQADLAAARADASSGQSFDALLAEFGIELSGANVLLPAVAPDEGLSAPFNSWFTLFGQFFDHGLDLVNKGGSGTVFIPLSPDDPLYVPGGTTNFMVLTRATVAPGPDGELGTADDVRPVNTTSPFVDQNQTYTSHPSHQVFVRQYERIDGAPPAATGNLLEGGNGGMATWGELKTHASTMLGIRLLDTDVGKVPLILTDPYGNFIPGANGFPQVVTSIALDGTPLTFIEGDPGANAGLGIDIGMAVRTNSAFLADIAHNATPEGIEDGDTEVGGNIPADGEYDDELLDAHFIAGDGRVNENIGLTAVHHVFHAEHNRLVEHTREVTLADARQMLADGATAAEAVAFLNEWLDVPVAAVPITDAEIAALNWDGERLFQAAKFGTEMQYQHLVFEEFARKIQPNINVFLVPDGYDATMNPTIMAEFAHVVYRFGHSMLTESIDRFDAGFSADHISLIQGFLNPLEFDSANDAIAAGDIIRGMTRQEGMQIDEFVTSALRNNLLGLPLDLATINLARGRDVGAPSLNAARREFYSVTDQAAELKPYESWVDFAGNLKNEASIINFIAAYGTHSLITGQSTIEGRRDAALTIITGVPVGNMAVPADAEEFLNGTGDYAADLGGLENVDLWIGGLAEKTMPFGGMLGSTFNFVFEVQMEALQSGDRFYYLQRLDGLHLFGEMEANSFAAMIMRNTDATHLPSDVFSTPAFNLEVNQAIQRNDLDGDGDMENTDPTSGGLLTKLVIRNDPATSAVDTNYLRYTGADHVVMGGTEGNDRIYAGIGDDTLYGDGGKDYLEGDFGNDIINGGAGDDIIRDKGGDDNIKGGDGNDAIHAGPGLDLVLAGRGNDFVVLGTDMGSEVFAGEGDDFVLGNKNAERILGNEGNDWIETGTFDGAPGDNFDEILAEDGIDGHDVFLGDGGFDEFIGEGGDDIMVGSLGRGKMAGMSGFDWATYKDMGQGVTADLSIPIIFDEAPTIPANAALDEFESMEGLSGSRFNDILRGSNDGTAERQSLADGGSSGFRGSVLDAEGIAMINGLGAVLGTGVTSFSAGDIILGGDGSDQLQGNGGDDILDGDRWLDVQIGVYAANDPQHLGTPTRLVSSMKELSAEVFSGAINPGQLQIVRTIRSDTTAGDTDTAIFSGARADYDISFANGRVIVNHARGTLLDGVDTLVNMERMRFSDMEIAVNQPATGRPTISDTTPTAGQTLTAGTGAIADPNGLGAFSYQWRASSDGGTSWAPIVGATSQTYALANAAGMNPDPYQNQLLSVQVSFTDGAGGAETVTSLATSPVGANWNGNGDANAFAGTAGDDIASGGGGADVLNGAAGNDTMNGNDGADTLNGGIGNDTLNGGAGGDTVNGDAGNDALNGNDGNDLLTGGDGNDNLAGGGGSDTAIFALAATSYALADIGGGGNGLSVTASAAGTEGTDTLGDVEILQFAGTTYAVVNGSNGNGNPDTLNTGNGRQAVFARGGNDVINGQGGDDLIYAGAGNDRVNQSSGAGRDFVDGGSGTDTYVLTGDASAETFNIMTRQAYIDGGGSAVLHAGTEIVITRNGIANIVAELDNIEEISVNTLNVTANNGGGLDTVGSGDTIDVDGDFTQTSLNYSTITVNGGRGRDVVDITGLDSDHRIVFNTNGGGDKLIGDVRPQDVIDGSDSTSYALDSSMIGALRGAAFGMRDYALECRKLACIMDVEDSALLWGKSMFPVLKKIWESRDDDGLANVIEYSRTPFDQRFDDADNFVS